jgi:hypothetical protein
MELTDLIGSPTLKTTHHPKVMQALFIMQLHNNQQENIMNIPLLNMWSKFN